MGTTTNKEEKPRKYSVSEKYRVILTVLDVLIYVILGCYILLGIFVGIYSRYILYSMVLLFLDMIPKVFVLWIIKVVVKSRSEKEYIHKVWPKTDQ